MIGFFLLVLLGFLIIENTIINSITIGILICVLILKMIFRPTVQRSISIKSTIMIFGYSLWYLWILVVNIIASNIHVAKIVLSPKIKIVPKIITIKTSLQTEFCKAILANSITLTPGTLTVTLLEDTLEIHCLDQKFIAGLNNLSFEKILKRVERTI